MTEHQLLIKSRADLDLMLANLEAGARVSRRSDFFSWVQGVFQGILGHEILICIVAETHGRGYRTDWMASAPMEERRLDALCEQGSGLVYRAMALWEEMGRRPLFLHPPERGVPTHAGLIKDLERLELDNILGHGVPDVEGRAFCLFSFSKVHEPVTEREMTAIDIMIPQLHAAWVRVCCAEAHRQGASPRPPQAILTAREVEILNWVERGKSNNEIGQILQISHLTVKNHVQKILRKLDVQNRAQAVAKGISLNLTHRR